MGLKSIPFSQYNNDERLVVCSHQGRSWSAGGSGPLSSKPANND